MITLGNRYTRRIFYNGKPVIKMYVYPDLVYTYDFMDLIAGTVSPNASGANELIYYFRDGKPLREWNTSLQTIVDLGDTTAFQLHYKDFYNQPAGSLWRLFSNSRLKTVNMTNFDFTNIRDTSYMFYNCKSLETVQLGGSLHYTTPYLKNMSYMFFGCSKLTSIQFPRPANTHLGLSSINDPSKTWDTSKVTTMQSMFESCKALTSSLSIENFDISSLTNAKTMFRDCENVTSIRFPNQDPLDNLNVTSIFSGCTSLTHVYATSEMIKKLRNSGSTNCGSITYHAY